MLLNYSLWNVICYVTFALRFVPWTRLAYLFINVKNDWSEARVDPLAALLIQGGGQTGKHQAVVLRAT